MSKKKKKIEPTAMLSSRTRKKSIVHSIRDSIATAYSIYSDFCTQTSLHGLKHTVADNLYFFERFLWFILTVAAFAGATYCALNQFTRYISEPVVVSLQRDYRSWTTAFPAVTICYLERVDPNKAKEFISRTWNITEEFDQEKYQYYYEFIELIAEVSFRRNLQNFWKYQNDDSVNNIDLLKLALYLHPEYPLETITSDERNVKWVQVMTEEGLCQTFNGQYAQHQKTDKKPWKPLDLMTCHYHSETCYVTISSMTYSARYFIHSPYDIATAISNPTGDVFSGDKLVTDFKVVEIEAADSIEGLTAKQRRCKYPNEWLGKSIKAYSFGLCMMDCRTRLALMFCGCRPYFHVKGAPKPQYKIKHIFLLLYIILCLIFCYIIVLFRHFANKMAKCAMHTAWRASVATSKSLSIYQKILQNVHACHNARNSIIIHTQKRFLIVSLGGTTALFVGASVLTVVEAILFIIRYIVSSLVEWHHKRKFKYQP